MIIKGRARGRSSQLAAHLLRHDQNEDIRVDETRGTAASDVPGALAEMEALTAAVHSKRPLYHASISPEAQRPLAEDQIRLAADTLERKLGLQGQPRVIVVHRKQGRQHLHVVWSRVDLERQRIISDAWSYRAHEEAARELEAAFGHRVIQGAHVPPSAPRRRQRAPKDHEYRQAERSGRSAAEVSAQLTALWQGSRDAEAFRKKLQEAGYVLARGDRRLFVVIDSAGNAHSLARRLGMRSRDLAARLGTSCIEGLPSVTEARNLASRRGKAPLLHARYRATAAALAAPARPSRSIRDVRQRPLQLLAATIGWINMPEHAPGIVMRRPALRYLPRGDTRYRAFRAIILAEFAAKIDAAYARMQGDELSSALARLADEREAALRALERLGLKDTAAMPPPARLRIWNRRKANRRFRMRRILPRR